MIKFSFEGEIKDLAQFARMIINEPQEVNSIPQPLLKQSESVALAEAIKEVETLPVETTHSDEPLIDVAESIKKNPCIDPSTGKYFTAFQDLVNAFDALVDNGQPDDAQALLKTCSTNGQYGGVPAAKWVGVTNNAKKLLRTQDKGSTKEAVDPVKQKSLLVAGGREFIAKNGKPALHAIFNEFEVSNLSGLDPSQYVAFAEKIGVTL